MVGADAASRSGNGGPPRHACPVAVLFLGCAFVLTLLLARSLVTQSDEGYTLNAACSSGTASECTTTSGCSWDPVPAMRFFCSGSWSAARVMSRRDGSRWGLGSRSDGRPLFAPQAAPHWGSEPGVHRRRLAVGELPLCAPQSQLIQQLCGNRFLLPFVRLTQSCPADPSGTVAAVGGRTTVDAALSGVAAGLVFLILPPKGGVLVAVAIGSLFAVRGRAFRPVLALLTGFLVVIFPIFLRWGPATLIQQWLVIPSPATTSGIRVAPEIHRRDCPARLGLAGDGIPPRRSHAQDAGHRASGPVCQHEPQHGGQPPGHQRVPDADLLVARRASARRTPAPRHAAAPGVLPECGPGKRDGRAAGVDRLHPGGRRLPGDQHAEGRSAGTAAPAFSNPRIAAAHAIYAGPFLPGLYYLLKKKNPFFVSETVVCNDDCQRQLIAQLAKVKPELAFLDYDMVAHLDYPRTGRSTFTSATTTQPVPATGRSPCGRSRRGGARDQRRSCLGMMRTGQGACWMTRAASLPRMAWARPLRPWVPMMMRSAASRGRVPRSPIGTPTKWRSRRESGLRARGFPRRPALRLRDPGPDQCRSAGRHVDGRRQRVGGLHSDVNEVERGAEAGRTPWRSQRLRRGIGEIGRTRILFSAVRSTITNLSMDRLAANPTARLTSRPGVAGRRDVQPAVAARIRGFICLNAHPAGCAANVDAGDRGRPAGRPGSGLGGALVVGGSTGYGLSSLLASAVFGYGARGWRSLERPPQGEKTASAGWYNLARPAAARAPPGARWRS